MIHFKEQKALKSWSTSKHKVSLNKIKEENRNKCKENEIQVNQDENSSTFYIKKRGIGSFCTHNDNIFMHILKKGATPLLGCFSFLFGSRVFLFLFFWRE